MINNNNDNKEIVEETVKKKFKITFFKDSALTPRKVLSMALWSFMIASAIGVGAGIGSNIAHSNSVSSDFKDIALSKEYKTPTHPTTFKAMELTESVCSNDLWVDWTDTDDNIIGTASNLSNEKGGYKEININPALSGLKLIDVAWHECAHAKTYSLDKADAKKFAARALELYPECKDENFSECLADTMALVKTGITQDDVYFYHNDHTPEQIALAEEIWAASPEKVTRVVSENEMTYEEFHKTWRYVNEEKLVNLGFASYEYVKDQRNFFPEIRNFTWKEATPIFGWGFHISDIPLEKHNH